LQPADAGCKDYKTEANMILIVKHIGIEGPGSLGEFFNNTSWQVSIVEIGAGEKLPDSLQGLQALIVLGGPMNVYEEAQYPFLKEEDTFLREAIKRKIPVLGICLGAQLLAKACGAAVTQNPEKEIGWYRLRLTDKGRQDPFFEGLPERFSVFQWHEDTFEVPAGAALLAEGDTCHNQAFRFGENAYGLQFHIEVTPEMIASWFCSYQGAAATHDIMDIMAHSHRAQRDLSKLADRIYLNFSRMIGAPEKAIAGR